METDIMSSLQLPPKMQRGTVSRLDRKAGFGYVLDDERQHNYVFVVGKALKHSQASALAVGRQVEFSVSGQGHVDKLVPA